MFKKIITAICAGLIAIIPATAEEDTGTETEETIIYETYGEISDILEPTEEAETEPQTNTETDTGTDTETGKETAEEAENKPQETQTEEQAQEPAEEAETLRAILEEVKEIKATTAGGGIVKAPAGNTSDYYGINRRQNIYIYELTEYYREYDYNTGQWIEEDRPWYFASNSPDISWDQTYQDWETINRGTLINIPTEGDKQQVVILYPDIATAKTYAYGDIPQGWRSNQFCTAGNYDKPCRGVIQLEEYFNNLPYDFAVVRMPTATGVDGQLSGTFSVYTVSKGTLETGPGERGTGFTTERDLMFYPASLEIAETIETAPAYQEPTLSDIYFIGGIIVILLLIIIFKRGRH